MIFDLTPARQIPPEILRNELELARVQAHFEHQRTGRISDATVERIRKVVATTETQLVIEEARLP